MDVGLAGVAFSALMVALVANPSASFAQSIRETVQIAIDSNPRVAGAVDNRRTADAELRQARGLYLPQVNLSGGYGPEYSDNSFTRTSGNAKHFRQDISAILTQRLYDGGDADGNVDSQKARSRATAHRVREAADLLALDAIEAHLDVVRLRRILDIAETNITSHRNILELVRRSATGGAGTQADLAQANSRLDQAITDREETRGLLREAEATYLDLTGIPPATLLEAPLAVGVLTAGIDASVRLAEQYNPTINASDADIESAKAQIDVADARFVPQISAEISGSHDRNVDGFPQRDEEARALIDFKWNLYAGGSDVANRDAAYGRYSKAKNDKLQVVRRTDEDLRRAWANYDASQRRVASLRRVVQSNKTVVAAYQQQYQAGRRSLIEVLDATNEEFQTQTRLVVAEETAVFAGYHILTVEGRLLTSLAINLPLESDPEKKAPRPNTSLP
ncbi:MAG TPA: TolC family outer membrane protein [Stellaceae bacterium]|nr:TolC family outer membrane protein [Stellaceae bacterium]